MEGLLHGLSLGQILLSGLAVYVAYGLTCAFYNAFFHPLSKFRGPRLRGAFCFASAYETWKGDVHYNWHALHEKYGEIVRVGPNTLSFIRPDAWREIYGHGNTAPLPKDPQFYHRPAGQPPDIIAANDADHARIRRPLNHAFSENALRSQESNINSYITLMIEKMQKYAKSGTPVDIMKWLNLTTFDITGDLTFDESFDALKNEEYNDWIASIFGLLSTNNKLRAIRQYPVIGVPVMALLQLMPGLAKTRQKMRNYARDKAARRLALKTERKDLMSYILKNNNGKDMSVDEVKVTSNILIMAGSETSATLLSGAIYYLATHPEWLAKLEQEVLHAFPKEQDITFDSVKPLKVLTAIINETFRLYPPVPISLPRVVPPQGATVCGTFLPAGTQLGIAQYAMNRSSLHFADPEAYHPERFLGHDKYAADKRHAMQPFSVGPRNCVGQSLAWAEIRTILVRLVWHFEFELQRESRGWEKQRVHALWQKPSLMVRLTARRSYV